MHMHFKFTFQLLNTRELCLFYAYCKIWQTQYLFLQLLQSMCLPVMLGEFHFKSLKMPHISEQNLEIAAIVKLAKPCRGYLQGCKGNVVTWLLNPGYWLQGPKV